MLSSVPCWIWLVYSLTNKVLIAGRFGFSCQQSGLWRYFASELRRVFRLLCSAVVQRYRSRSLHLFPRDTCIFTFDSALFFIVHQGVRSVAVCLCFRVWLLRLKPGACLHHNVRRRFVCYLRCVFACSCCCRIAACAYVCSALMLRCTARSICSLRGYYIRMDSLRVRILFVARASPFGC